MVSLQESTKRGSPTKVSKIKSITLAGGAMQMYHADEPGIQQLINDIMQEYVEVA